MFLAAIFWIQPPAVLIATRNLFSWSFDRLLPGKLADVNERLHSPVIATIVIAIVIEVFTYITIKTNYFGQLLGLAAFSALVGTLCYIAFTSLAFGGTPDVLNPSFLRGVFFTSLGIIIPGLFYFVSQLINRTRKLDISQAFKDIPPE